MEMEMDMDMYADIDSFVNDNEPNVRFELTSGDAELMFETLPLRFARMFEHDTVDFDGDPVLVYHLGEKMVAWYDQENAYGYIA